MSEPPSSAPPSSPPASSTPAPEAFAPGRRRLCPDGTCVGVIGADGRCRTCGLVDPQGPPAVGAEAAGGRAAEEDPLDALEANDVDSDSDEDAADQEALLAEGTGFDPRRPLCPDGGCLGVIAADGRCTVCGRGPEAAGA